MIILGVLVLGNDTIANWGKEITFAGWYTLPFSIINKIDSTVVYEAIHSTIVYEAIHINI